MTQKELAALFKSLPISNGDAVRSCSAGAVNSVVADIVAEYAIRNPTKPSVVRLIADLQQQVPEVYPE